MPAVDHSSDVSPPEALQFGCPACFQELSIPLALAGVTGPCPVCGTGISAPVPEANLPARLLPTPGEAAIPESGPPSPPPPEAVPEAIPEAASEGEALAHVHCSACRCELAIEPALAHLPGGPCPECGTWIDLQGRQSPPAEAVWGAEPEPTPTPPSKPEPDPEPEPEPQAEDAAESAWPSESAGALSEKEQTPMGDSAGPVELNQAFAGAKPDPSRNLSFRRIIAPTEVPEPKSAERWDAENDAAHERRRVKKRKRRRRLPPEFYVGHAAGELDARGQESASRMRTNPFPEGGAVAAPGPAVPAGDAAVEKEAPWTRWVPVLFGMLIPLLGGLYAAVQFDFIDAAEFRWWDSAEAIDRFDPLAEGIGRTERVLKGKTKESYQAIEDAIGAFFGASRWEEAEAYLSLEDLPEDSPAPAYLKLFPRDLFRGARVRVIDYARIPQTERFIFTTHVENGVDGEGEEILTFLIGEEREFGPPKLHALQLYQSWKQTLTEFLETSGARGSRFYGRLRLVDGGTTLTFPDDGPYVKLEMEDWLVKQPWIKEIYVRKESWAGTRLLTGLTEDWAMAVVDLEWRKGPSGDAFVQVVGVQSSHWGDFPK